MDTKTLLQVLQASLSDQKLCLVVRTGSAELSQEVLAKAYHLQTIQLIPVFIYHKGTLNFLYCSIAEKNGRFYVHGRRCLLIKSNFGTFCGVLEFSAKFGKFVGPASFQHYTCKGGSFELVENSDTKFVPR